MKTLTCTARGLLVAMLGLTCASPSGWVLCAGEHGLSVELAIAGSCSPCVESSCQPSGPPVAQFAADKPFADCVDTPLLGHELFRSASRTALPAAVTTAVLSAPVSLPESAGLRLGVNANYPAATDAVSLRSVILLI